MASFTDDFNRADGAMGSNWTTAPTFGAMQVFSNQARADAAGRCVAHVAASAVTFADDQQITATFTTVALNDRVGLAVRVNPTTGGGYYFFVDTAARGLSYYDGSTYTDLTTVPERFTASSGDVFRLRAVGTTIEVIKNGSTIVTKTDSSATSGQPAITYQFDNTRASRIDNVTAEDVSSGPSPAVLAFFLR